jgi:Caspase domain
MKHHIPVFRATILALTLAVLISLAAIGPALSCVPVEKGIKSYCRNEPSLSRLLNVVWPNSTPYQIAVVAGIANYPNLPRYQQLPPVDYDVDQLSAILRDKLGFDEVIILKDKDFSEKNLKYLFSVYIPSELRARKNSQVLFAYSGHGADYQDSGYLFLADTATIELHRDEDLVHTMDLEALRVLMKPTITVATHFLVLLNSCKGGYFVTPQSFTSTFGATQLKARGAHGITAGGRDNNVHASPNVGSGKGSVFFEMVFAALNGSGVNLNGTAFPNPADDNGILSSIKLATFLDSTVSKIENGEFGPQMARLTPGEGYFFFITDEEKANRELRKIYPKDWTKVFGTPPDEPLRDGNNGSPVKQAPKITEPDPKPRPKPTPTRNPPSPAPKRTATGIPPGYFCSPNHHLHRLGGAFSGLPERRETRC